MRLANSSFQWYKMVVDANGNKTRVLRQLDDLPTLASSWEDLGREYGKKHLREVLRERYKSRQKK